MNAKAAIGPLVILGLGVASSAFLLSGRPAAAPLAPEPELPVARVLTVVEETLRLRVFSQGTAVPRTESELIAEVPGRVLHVHPGLEPGAYFRAGDLLASLDPRDLELAVKRSEAGLERARAEEEFAQATLERQRTLRGRSVASVAILDETRRAARIAAARRLEAEVDLASAQRNLERARIVAPFDGRTRLRSVDVGRYVSVGTSIGQIYAVDYAEVRLPLPDFELAFLDLPMGEELPANAGPEVMLTASFAGAEHRWVGRIVRTEAAIDPRTRMVHVIARVPRPYAQDGQAPLAAGLFVKAEILGREVGGVARVPRAALEDERTLWVVDGKDRLRRRAIEVLRLERETALVSGGLMTGERVSLLEPRSAREGMAVRPTEPESLARRLIEDEPAS